MSDPTVSMRITARDDTAKGVGSAEKRVGAMAKRTSRLNRAALEDFDRGLTRSGGAIVKTFGQVEQATARLVGSSGLTGGLTSRLGGITSATSALGSGMAEAGAAGEGLIGVIGTVGAAAAGAVAAVVGLAAGAWNIASGFSKAALSIGNTASEIGVSTEALQRFTAAAGAVGVDQKSAAGSLGGLSQTLNDARYGRNTAALAVLQKLGIQLQLNADGTVNVEAMLPLIADAIARQNSSGRRTVARLLGISLDTLPAFTGGGKQLSADMKSAKGLFTDNDVKQAKDFTRDQSDWQQGLNSYLTPIGRGVTGGVAGIVDSATRFIDPGGRASDGGGGGSPRVSDGVSGLHGGVLNLTPKDVIDLKKTVQTEWDGQSVNQLKGIVDTILNRQASGKWGSTIADVVNARSQFSDINGPVAWAKRRHSVDDLPASIVRARTAQLVDQYLRDRAAGADSIVDDNLSYANPYYSDQKNRKWIDKLVGPTFGSGKSIHRHGTTPDLERYRPGDYDLAIPVNVTVELKGAPSGTRTTVRAGRGKPAISTAVQP